MCSTPNKPIGLRQWNVFTGLHKDLDYMYITITGMYILCNDVKVQSRVALVNVYICMLPSN